MATIKYKSTVLMAIVVGKLVPNHDVMQSFTAWSLQPKWNLNWCFVIHSKAGIATMSTGSNNTSPSSGAANAQRFYARDLRSALPHCQWTTWENHERERERESQLSKLQQYAIVQWHVILWSTNIESKITETRAKAGSWALPSRKWLCPKPKLSKMTTK